MAFTVVKKLDLSFLGDGWNQGTYLRFNSMTFAETREFAKLNANTNDPADDQNLDMVMNLLTNHFVDGMGFDGEKITEIASSDLPNLPTDVITKAIELLAGSPDPKS